MASPFVPVPLPMGNSSSSRSPRRSSLGSTSTSSNSSKEPPEDRQPAVYKKMSVPEQASCSSSMCSSPFIRTKFDSSVEYNTRPGTDSHISDISELEERPSTPSILGYEVMEERAKFTLKEMFPGFRLALPPKRWFKDNYEYDFLEDRQLGLQAFLQNLVAHKDIAHCAPVRLFLCLDEPPGPFDSLEESRAFCETLEETNYRLQRDLLDKQKEVDELQKLLNERNLHIQALEAQIQELSGGTGISRRHSGEGSECSGEVESSAIEADQTASTECSSKDSQENCWVETLHGDTLPEIEVAEVADPDADI
uniref:Sorting nexin 16 n=1 Tax=Leptobrachium leishanense TaxID=445787 RepID=A0A8C5QTQ3_9ANUR